jgi:hypothetical protein
MQLAKQLEKVVADVQLANVLSPTDVRALQP